MSDNLNLPYDLSALPREQRKYYIGADDNDTQQMLASLGAAKLEDLFQHIDPADLFQETPQIGDELPYAQLKEHLEAIAAKNNIKPSFIGDGLKAFKPNPIIDKVAAIRGLTTAYTPYQPERSQGTLYTLWFYASCMKELTGFEAINASLYERSTCLYEAIQTAKRLHKKGSTALVPQNLYPGDIEVLNTLAAHTDLNIVYLPTDLKTGRIDRDLLKVRLEKEPERYCALVFSQVNNFGVYEKVDELTDLADQFGLKSIAIIDPIHLGDNGLKAPCDFGSHSQGTTMIVAEGQHLAIDANYGGPGLGIFGIRFNEKDKVSIRSTAGRYVGKTKDQNGADCLSMVLSTREQHIRREKATSNICSNQSFVASLAGANMLNLGSQGIGEKFKTACDKARDLAQQLLQLKGVELAFDSAFTHEFCLKVEANARELIMKAAREHQLHIGVDFSSRINNENQYLLISVYDHHSEKELEQLVGFFKSIFTETKSQTQELPTLAAKNYRQNNPNIPAYSEESLVTYYQQLGELNFSPDDNLYPLGSCTMKYNPYINDYAAGLPGFTQGHPQAPLEDNQGNLEILFEIQEMFKNITGLPGVTTQPVAGAQGELVGIKLFQAYHQDRGEGGQRDLILIPRSAHGTNPATATMAGFQVGKKDGRPTGIITIQAGEDGQMNLQQIKEIVDQYGKHIAGIMVTNPNTSGIFESQFRQMSEMIHQAGGLVYMDGANMNAIASWVDLGKLGVDAVHNNLHKTWTIPHGGGGPGDAIVAVSEKLLPFLPGHVYTKDEQGRFGITATPKSIGRFHRHGGNFAHKVRCYTYLKALGSEGVKAMSAMAVLSARYLYQQLNEVYPFLPAQAGATPRMHEFIITLDEKMFDSLASGGVPKAKAIAQVGKLFLDFGMHPPTVAFPEALGLMIEPTESFTKAELDRFIQVLKAIRTIIVEHPALAASAPHKSPILKVDEVYANKHLQLAESMAELPKLPSLSQHIEEINHQRVDELLQGLLQ